MSRTPGELAWGLSLALDVTARHQMEEALRANEQRLVSIYNAVDDVIMHLEVEAEGHFRVLAVNAAFLRATELTIELTVGKTTDEVIPEPSLTRARGQSSNTWSKKKPSCVGKKHLTILSEQ